jgi:probable F420-dependent oxidoreductase
LTVSVIPEGSVVYGMQLPVQAQSEMFVADWERTSGPDELVRIARKADEAGFFYVAVCDHVAIPRRLAGAMGTTWYDTVATLGMLAGVTSRVRLMSHVAILAYRHPLVAAKSFATLDALSKGRLIIGVGAGHVADEFAALGVDFARRGQLLDEGIDALRAALCEEFADIDGPTWRAHDLGVGPRPVQSPPPIWVGGSSKAALRRAAERGDGWLPQGTPRAEMPDQIAHLLEHRRHARGDDPIAIGTVCEPVHIGRPTWDVGDATLCGTAEEIAESFRQFVDMGVSHLQVRFKARTCDELLDQMDAFAAGVAPRLSG